MITQLKSLTMSPDLFQLLPSTSSPRSIPHLRHERISITSLQEEKPDKNSSIITRRSTAILLATPLLSPLFHPYSALALDLRLTVPDQTLEEAESIVKSHAQSLLDVKDLLVNEEYSSSWKEAQKQLRKSSGLLRQDLYTIIQGKSPELRPRLRKLYADLFNGVVKLDYAIRDKKDRDEVWECYGAVVVALDEFLSRV